MKEREIQITRTLNVYKDQSMTKRTSLKIKVKISFRNNNSRGTRTRTRAI